MAALFLVRHQETSPVWGGVEGLPPCHSFALGGSDPQRPRGPFPVPPIAPCNTPLSVALARTKRAALELHVPGLCPAPPPLLPRRCLSSRGQRRGLP